MFLESPVLITWSRFFFAPYCEDRQGAKTCEVSPFLGGTNLSASQKPIGLTYYAREIL